MGDFISRHKQEWDELAALLQRGRRSAKRLSPDEKHRLDVLYRRATVHLSQVQTRTTDAQLVGYLNSLTAAAHSLIYLPPREPALRGLWRFLSEGFARSIARQWRFHAVSLGLMLAGFSTSYCSTAAGSEGREYLTYPVTYRSRKPSRS